jgi:hypothetical protein
MTDVEPDRRGQWGSVAVPENRLAPAGFAAQWSQQNRQLGALPPHPWDLLLSVLPGGQDHENRLLLPRRCPGKGGRVAAELPWGKASWGAREPAPKGLCLGSLGGWMTCKTHITHGTRNGARPSTRLPTIPGRLDDNRPVTYFPSLNSFRLDPMEPGTPLGDHGLPNVTSPSGRDHDNTPIIRRPIA